jgi:hypothetical protein
LGFELPCWPCYLKGFDTLSPEEHI